jgi:aryl-alcohol dehydrogenase-like predicted oxidoreductase
VVSKVGYLQGENYALSQQRKDDGRPFEELVEYAEGLEHCIHPAFIEDQLQRSLERLGLETIDFYLLHNPEYYLEWAHKQGMALEAARAEYYRRIEAAFRHLESEVTRGRIRYYGVSSNTLVSKMKDHDFTELHKISEIARSISADHHLALIQMPFNLVESDAVLESNQPEGRSVLAYAQAHQLGVLINRPLNAFTGQRMIRLAKIEVSKRQDHDDIIFNIRALIRSEKQLWKKMLPGMDLMPGIKARIKEQLSVGDHLKHYHLNFGSYDNWRHARSRFYLPRVQGVIDFFQQHGADDEAVADWVVSHQAQLQKALTSVGSIYAAEADREIKEIKALMAAADNDWAQEGTLSQKAIRAIKTTAGVSAVLVGMRQDTYVKDVVAELQRDTHPGDRTRAWRHLKEGLDSLLAAS